MDKKEKYRIKSKEQNPKNCFMAWDRKYSSNCCMAYVIDP